MKTLRKRNHKWVKLKSYKMQRAGRRGARWYKVTFTLDCGHWGSSVNESSKIP